MAIYHTNTITNPTLIGAKRALSGLRGIAITMEFTEKMIVAPDTVLNQYAFTHEAFLHFPETIKDAVKVIGDALRDYEKLKEEVGANEMDDPADTEELVSGVTQA